MPIKRVVPLAASLLLLPVGVATAHHGFSGRYDLGYPVWIEGEVSEAYFGQPHAELTIRVSDSIAVPEPAPDLGPTDRFIDVSAMVVRPETVGQPVVVELPPTQQYFSLSDRIAVGDRVAIVALRNCEPPHQYNGQWLRLEGGETVARSRAMSYMIDGC